MNDDLKREHLEGKHKGYEEDYSDSCILCENFVNSKKAGTLSGTALGVSIIEEANTDDIFGV